MVYFKNLLNVHADVQPTDIFITAKENPLVRALLVDDARVECYLNMIMSVPAFFIVSIHQRLTVHFFTSSCGALKLANNWHDFLIVSVLAIYTFNNATLHNFRQWTLLMGYSKISMSSWWYQECYHALEGFSSSGMKKLRLLSISIIWFKVSF